jgi:hypothetical protein
MPMGNQQVSSYRVISAKIIATSITVISKFEMPAIVPPLFTTGSQTTVPVLIPACLFSSIVKLGCASFLFPSSHD